MYKVYTDGACSNNRRGEGIGGFGAVITDGRKKVIKKVGGSREGTTNNRMELWAVVAGLKTILKLTNSKNNIDCIIYSDSKYVVSNYIDNLSIWRYSNWRKSNGKEVLNVDLWKKLVYYIPMFNNVKFMWVRGHDGNELNEVADQIATKFVEKLKRRLK